VTCIIMLPGRDYFSSKLQNSLSLVTRVKSIGEYIHLFKSIISYRPETILQGYHMGFLDIESMGLSPFFSFLTFSFPSLSFLFSPFFFWLVRFGFFLFHLSFFFLFFVCWWVGEVGCGEAVSFSRMGQVDAMMSIMHL